MEQLLSHHFLDSLDQTVSRPSQHVRNDVPRLDHVATPVQRIVILVNARRVTKKLLGHADVGKVNSWCLVTF